MRYAVQLPHDPGSIPAARRTLSRLEGEVDELTMRNARLLVSELVTNAVRHVPAEDGDEIGLVVEREGDLLRVEVADRGPGFSPGTDTRNASSGWGLQILSTLAARWGVETEGGARVWFELEAPRPS